MFNPRFQITPATAKCLMEIEADRQILARVPLTANMIASLRRSARLLSTHFSTRIEGNTLTQSQVESVISGEGNFPGRERDELEVKHYFAALEQVQKIAGDRTILIEREIRTLHGLVMTGKPKASAYRKVQNVIRDSRTGRVVYLPPEAADVPRLMKELVAWLADAVKLSELPAPVIAALIHYQFAVIHPYLDGNGRTARLLVNLVLQRLGYGIKGLYCLEEHYATNLEGYYSNLALGTSHNYYFGRVEADITPFLDYFCCGMASAFAAVRIRGEAAERTKGPGVAGLLRDLTPQQRHLLGLFRRRREVTRNDVAKFFKLKPRSSYDLIRHWLDSGFLEVAQEARKSRTYRLAQKYEVLIASR